MNRTSYDYDDTMICWSLFHLESSALILVCIRPAWVYVDTMVESRRLCCCSQRRVCPELKSLLERDIEGLEISEWCCYHWDLYVIFPSLSVL